ncbi:MAG: hypothetical protein IPK68_10410 [Bdellovibrionales bacterium]|nr:hypothetical protein [Bdellovibrionales bacterium]
MRLTEYKLAVNEDKTALINFAKDQENIFSFLGFTFFWNKRRRWNKINLVIKTQRDKLAKKIQEFTEWIKLNRTRMNRKEIWSIVAAKLRGHYNYFGYYCNRGKLMLYYKGIIGALFKWLNRRSQTKSFTWGMFKRLLSREPLPLPPETTQLKHLGWSPYVK